MPQRPDPSVTDLPTSERDRPGRMSLDVARFLAAGLILIYHFSANLPGQAAGAGDHAPLFQGWIATDFFLILSGFVMSRSYLNRLSAGRVSPLEFFTRRWLRLWPSHAVVLLAFLGFVGLSLALGIAPNHADKFRLDGFIEEFCLIHGWGFVAEPGWNVPTWSLSALIICYALFAVLAPLIGRFSKLRLWAALIGSMAFAMLVFPAVTGHDFADLPFRFGLLRAVPLFFGGCLIERLSRELRLMPRQFGQWLAILSLVLIELVLLQRHALSDALILMSLGALIAVAGAVCFKETAISQRLGRSAYSLFLTHSLVGAVWFGLSGHLLDQASLPPFIAWSLWLTGIAAALTVALVFEALIDRPLSRWSGRLMAKPDRRTRLEVRP